MTAILAASGNPVEIFGQVDTEFWFVVPELSHRNGTGGTPGSLRIATLDLEATVTITMPANAWHPTLNPAGFQDIVVLVGSNSSQLVDLTSFIDVASLPGNNRLENKPLTVDGINPFGLYITASNPVTLFWEINHPSGGDLWTLKGSNALGTEFFTPFQTIYNNRNLTPVAYSAMDIVATEDNTQVTVTLPPGKAGSYGTPVNTVPAGGSHVVILDRGETFSMFPQNYTTLASGRLAGTRVQATAPVAVTVKDDALAVGSGGQDVVGDQLVPVDVTGNRYIVPSMVSPNHVYVLATSDNTPIYVTEADGGIVGSTPYTTLNQGEQALITIPSGTEFIQITSNSSLADTAQPFYVFHLGNSNQSRGGALIPPIGCTGNTELSFTRSRADNQFYLQIITQVGLEDKFMLDGVLQDGSDPDMIIEPDDFVPISGSGGWVAWRSGSISAGDFSVGHHLMSNTGGVFHLSIVNGFPGTSLGRLFYGNYSDFGPLNIQADLSGAESDQDTICFGEEVQLSAYGGTTYQWIPSTYLDDPTSDIPIASNLPAGIHNYSVVVSGTCNSDTVDLSFHVAEPVVAQMESDIAAGCSPLEVEVEDKAEGAYYWEYDLGDGSPVLRYDLDPASPIPPPPSPFTFTHTYTNNDTLAIDYTITLVTTNANGCSDSVKRVITVYPEIHSGFTFDLNDSCDPLQVSFTNSSLGNTDTWVWEFGDGGSSTERDPQHEFRNQFGPDNLIFDTRLIAISPYLCRDTSSQTFTVRPFIEASFAFDTVAACSPHEIIITDQSTGADSYSWDFGDGTTSTSPGPVLTKTYVNTTGAPLTYTITLSVNNEEGCSDQISRDVTVYPEISAAFTADQVLLCSPGEISFSNNSSGAASYSWDFGDGGTSNQIHPVKYYDRNMTDQDTTFTVSLIATSSEFCKDTATIDVTVSPFIEAAYTVEDVVGCHPFTVTIDNESYGVNTYAWDFGDGTPASNSGASSLIHTFNNGTAATQVYQLELIVFNDEGCSDTMVRDITVHPEITANFSADLTDGCHPLSVNFTDMSVNAVTYLWDFGDGAGSTLPSPSHSFVNFGAVDTTYMVSLVISTDDGECLDQHVIPITVRPQLTADFAFQQALGCGPLEVTFMNLSVGGTDFTWDFGDGTVINTPDTTSQVHTFINNDFANTRDFEVRLVARNTTGCSREIRKTVRVYPDIQAGFSASSLQGCHPVEVSFTNLTLGGNNYVWDFGDGTSSDLLDPAHTFTNTGNIDSVYSVSLLATAPNNLCRDTFFMDITVHPYIQANFTLPEHLGCTPFQAVLENSTIHGTQFRWDFGDGTDTITLNTNPITHTFINTDFNNRQQYVITLEAESSAGCINSVQRTISVEPDIDARFLPDALSGCHPLSLDFTDLSSGGAFYNWDFGNGTSSQLSDPSQTFTNIGPADSTYRIRLDLTASNNSCTDSFYTDIVVHPYIHADFTFPEQVNCSPSTVPFNNATVGGTSFQWDFDDGSDSITSDTALLSHIFTNGSFTTNAAFMVTLTAENEAGCSSQVTKTVEVYPHIAADISLSVDEGCHPLAVSFTNLSSGSLTFAWDLGDGITSDADNPVHTYTNYTDDPLTRQVHLLATSRFDCTSEITTDVIIHPKPKARFETDGNISCPPFNLPVINNSLNADQYTWDLGGDTLFTTPSASTFNHVFDNLTGDILTYELRMLAQSDFGCADSAQQKIYVYPYTNAAFSTNDGGCSPFNAYFINQSVRGETYQWDFGDGSSSTVSEPSQVYFNFTGFDTLYHITLISTSKFGCTDSISDSIEVYAQPHAEFIADPTHQEYPSTTVQLTNTSFPGNWTYSWDMGDGTTYDQENPAPHTYGTWGTYVIGMGVSSAHCSDSISHTIRIFPTTPVADFDSVIPDCEPLTVRFTNNSLYAHTYLWEFGDGTTSSEFEPLHTFEDAGIYNVKLTIDGDGGTEVTYRQVEVFKMPLVEFDVIPDTVMLPDDLTSFINQSDFGAFYLWNFGDGTTSAEEQPLHQYTAVGIYDVSLDVYTINGCYDRLVKPALVTVLREGVILFPNAFKPDLTGPNGGYYDLNEPEKNNIFHPYWEGVAKYNLEIWDRWGVRMFYSNEVDRGWDGYYKGELCEQDVYVFKSWGIFTNGETFEEMGDVTLLHDPK